MLKISERVVEVACGSIHTLVKTNFSRVFSCGNGGSYALGHGNRESCHSFKLIESLNDLDIKRIGCGMNHSGCLTEDGQVLTWGVCGDVSFSKMMKEECLLKLPTKISFAKSDSALSSSRRSKSKTFDVVIEDIKLGENFTVALSNTGQVYSWGSNEFGQLGLGDDQPISQPALVTKLIDNK